MLIDEDGILEIYIPAFQEPRQLHAWMIRVLSGASNIAPIFSVIANFLRTPEGIIVCDFSTLCGERFIVVYR